MDQLRERFTDGFIKTGWLKKIGAAHPPALEAILFFSEAMLDWSNDITEAALDVRTMAFTTSILTDLSFVCISLGDDDDDAQVIFETLNSHGA